MPSPEQLVELAFPLRGINTATEYQLQPDGTTPIAVNVRSIDPIEHRNRGASRCGIRKYVDQKLGLLSLIQHLNVIVDPTIEATISEVDSPRWLDESSPNPSPRGRQMRRDNKYMRKGGSGVQHRKNTAAPRAVDDTINIQVGDAPVTIQPLANDTYSGAATFEVVGTSRNFVGSYSIAGPIGGWDFTYTPPATGDARTMLVGYTLRAAGNRGKGGARIIINLSAATPFPSLGGSATYGDTLAARYAGGSDPWYGAVENGVGTPATPEYVQTNLIFFSPGFGAIPAEYNETTSGPSGTIINIGFIGDELMFDALWTEFEASGGSAGVVAFPDSGSTVEFTLEGAYDGDNNFVLDAYDFTPA